MLRKIAIVVVVVVVVVPWILDFGPLSAFFVWSVHGFLDF